MPGIYDIFRAAASGAEKVPFQWRLLAGAGAGVLQQLTNGDESLDFGEKVLKGITVGGAIGLGASGLIRGAGRVASGAEKLGRFGITRKISAVQQQGWKALMRPGTLAIAGGVAGAALAPRGYGLTGAVAGAGLGFAAIPGVKLYKGYEALGRVPGATTGALIAAAAVPVAVAGVFGNGTPEAEGAAMRGLGGEIDYQPIDGGMKNRMVAMNASGDIVLGLHGRQHG